MLEENKVLCKYCGYRIESIGYPPDWALKDFLFRLEFADIKEVEKIKEEFIKRYSDHLVSKNLKSQFPSELERELNSQKWIYYHCGRSLFHPEVSPNQSCEFGYKSNKPANKI